MKDLKFLRELVENCTLSSTIEKDLETNEIILVRYPNIERQLLEGNSTSELWKSFKKITKNETGCELIITLSDI